MDFISVPFVCQASFIFHKSSLFTTSVFRLVFKSYQYNHELLLVFVAEPFPCSLWIRISVCTAHPLSILDESHIPQHVVPSLPCMLIIFPLHIMLFHTIHMMK